MPETIITTEQKALALAEHYPVLRTPCFYCKGSGSSLWPDPKEGPCLTCHGAGYLPNLTTDAMLEVCRAKNWQVTLSWPPGVGPFAGLEGYVQAPLGQRPEKRYWQGVGPTANLAIQDALDAATFGGA